MHKKFKQTNFYIFFFFFAIRVKCNAAYTSEVQG
jgi:hypothetical protein